MIRPLRPAPRAPALLLLLPLALLAATGTGGLAAQDLPPGRFDAAAAAPFALPAPAAPLTPAAAGSHPGSHSGSHPVAAPRRSLGRVAAGTLIGGALGGGLGALGGVFLGSAGSDDDYYYLSEGEVFGAIGLIAGYTLGSAVGARRAAAVDGARPGLGRVVLYSALGAALGGLVWNRVGEGLESEGSMSAWYLGAGLGVGTHMFLTAHGARTAPRPAPAAPPG